MQGIARIYKGRPVSEEGFRAFVYSKDGTRRLVNSWKEFEAHLQTGVWFDSKLEEEVLEAPKRTRKKRGE